MAAEIDSQGLRDAVELCVHDNGSTDETPAVLEEFRASRPWLRLRWARHASNQGFARNLLAATRLAEGEHLLLAGDDDLLLSGALASVSARLDSNPALLVFNSASGEATPARAGIAPGGEIRFESADEGVGALGVFQLSYIGNLVFRREAFREHHDERLLLSAYPHVGVALGVIQAAPAGVRFVNERLFSWDDSLRHSEQPLWSGVDMARIQTEYLLARSAPLAARHAARIYRLLLRSIPRAVLWQRSHRAPLASENPFRSLALSNLLDAYRASSLHAGFAAALLIAGAVAPRPVLSRLLGGPPT